MIVSGLVLLMIPIGVSPEVEESGRDIEENAERAYSDEEEYGKL
jgi:Amt family ammonium transporter